MLLVQPSLLAPPPPQNPDVVDAPLRLQLQVTAPPQSLIKPSGSSVSVTATLHIFLAPLDQPLIQLSSMTMVSLADRTDEARARARAPSPATRGMAPFP